MLCTTAINTSNTIRTQTSQINDLVLFQIWHLIIVIFCDECDSKRPKTAKVTFN